MKGLPTDFSRLLSGDRRVAAIVVDTRFRKSQRDVEAFLEFVSARVDSLTAQDREELIEQAHRDAPAIRRNKNFGTDREGWGK